MQTIIFDIDGVLLLNGRRTPLASLAASFLKTYHVVIVTSRAQDSGLLLVMLAAIDLGDCRLIMRPEDSVPSNAWKMKTILALAQEHEIAAVFEDNPSVLAALSAAKVPIVPIYSGYYSRY